ncbi:MAG: polyprenyl synthetase family protein [Actinomycetota bacterium]|nr:polyprenyl synthetase family protein [Actinomycetota bacterium]MDI6821848.1 polyprenyl synthetase family protein [Actinomycetota bacterium]
MFEFYIELKGEMIRILADLERDIRVVKKEFEREVSLPDSLVRTSAGHNAFKGQGRSNRRFILTPLLLISAKFGRYNFRKLKPVAVALELLDLAVRKHYAGTNIDQRRAQPETLNPKPEDNLALICGDYYYAKALTLVSALGDSRVIRILAEAIANIAEGEVLPGWPIGQGEGLRRVRDWERFYEKLRKKASLQVASCHLGALLAECSEEMIVAFTYFGQNAGLVCELVKEMYRFPEQESLKLMEEARSFCERAREFLRVLPDNPYRDFLHHVIDTFLV